MENTFLGRAGRAGRHPHAVTRPPTLAVVLLLGGCTFDPSGVAWEGAPEDPGSPPGEADAGGPPPGEADAAATPPGDPDAGATAMDPACDLAPPDLVACWTFEPGAMPDRFDDGSGHDNHAYATGAAATAGVAGAALQVGLSARVRVLESASLDVTTALTIEAWVRLDALPATRAWVLDHQGQYGLSITSSGAVRCSTGAFPFVSSRALAVGTWTHVACVFDGGERRARVYVDGKREGEVEAGPALSTTPNDGIILGGDCPCFAAPCNDALSAAIDQVRVWSSARSASELCAAAGHDRCGGD